MASGKATADAASGIEHSTIVTTMARNGTEIGPAGERHRRALVYRTECRVRGLFSRATTARTPTATG